MKDLWLKIGCYLTGYSYTILKNSSYASTKTVKKYMSALVIVSVIWGFVGYNFSQRYLQTTSYVSTIVALVMVIIVIQIERQIILTSGKNIKALIFRIIIGIVMAVVGSVIIDQIIFKEDIEKQKITNIQEEVNSTLQTKTLQLENDIVDIEKTIVKKEAEYASLNVEFSRKPMITRYTTTKTIQTDSTGKEIMTNTAVNRHQIANPIANQIPAVENQINLLREQKTAKEEIRMNMRASLENELKSKTGFLDELSLMFSILLNSTVAMVVWSFIFVFFFSMELFVIVAKWGDDKNDYDEIVNHQMIIKMKQLEKLRERPVGEKFSSN